MSTDPREFPMDEIRVELDCGALSVTMHTNQWDKVKLHIEALEQKLAVAVEALELLLERIDFNGGLGEYKGGPAFCVGRAREALALISATKGDR